MKNSNEDNNLSVLKLNEIKLDDIEIIEEAIQPGGIVCGFGCVAGGVLCGMGGCSSGI